MPPLIRSLDDKELGQDGGSSRSQSWAASTREQLVSFFFYFYFFGRSEEQSFLTLCRLWQPPTTPGPKDSAVQDFIQVCAV